MKSIYIKLTLVIVILLIIIFSPLKNYINIDKLLSYLESIRSNPFSETIYVAIYIIGVVFALPGLALTLTAAPIFGLWKGIILVIIGANIGCQLTFFISRFFGKDFVSKFIKNDSFIDKLSNKIEKNGFIVMLYMRLIPVFPFNVINYVSGLTKISYRDYSLGSFLGMLPGTVIYVYLSYTVSDIKDNPIGIFISLGILLIFSLGIYIFKKTKTKDTQNGKDLKINDRQ